MRYDDRGPSETWVDFLESLLPQWTTTTYVVTIEADAENKTNGLENALQESSKSDL